MTKVKTAKTGGMKSSPRLKQIGTAHDSLASWDLYGGSLKQSRAHREVNALSVQNRPVVQRRPSEPGVYYKRLSYIYATQFERVECYVNLFGKLVYEFRPFWFYGNKNYGFVSETDDNDWGPWRN